MLLSLLKSLRRRYERSGPCGSSVAYVVSRSLLERRSVESVARTTAVFSLALCSLLSAALRGFSSRCLGPSALEEDAARGEDAADVTRSAADLLMCLRLYGRVGTTSSLPAASPCQLLQASAISDRRSPDERTHKRTRDRLWTDTEPSTRRSRALLRRRRVGGTRMTTTKGKWPRSREDRSAVLPPFV